MTWACRMVIDNPHFGGPALGWACHFGRPSTWCVLHAWPPNPQNIPAGMQRSVCPPVWKGKGALRDGQRLTQGHMEKRAETGQEGPRPVSLQDPLLATCRSLELFTTSSEFRFLKEGNSILTAYFERTDVLGIWRGIFWGKITCSGLASTSSSSGREWGGRSKTRLVLSS